ncbi:MAG: hypothetical protein WBW76_03520 [Candidatus Cybelea sp.]
MPDLSSALALRDPQAIAPFPRYGCGTAVQARSGVAAFFVLESYDRRRGVATYALQVVNETQTRLVCRAWVVTRHGNAAFAHPATFEIEPFSAIAMQMPVRVRDFDSFERAVAEIAGDDVHYVVEAAPPPVRSRRSTFMMGAAAVLIFGTLAIGATCLLAGMIPRIAAFAVPPMALAGTTVAAEYDAVGFGSLAYQVLAPDGHRVAGGALSDRSGSIPVALSPSSDGGAYTLQMTMRGPLGSAKEVRVLNAIPPKIGGGARIADIAVNPIVAKPGQAVSIAYAANGDSGYVRLVGSDGTIWAQKPYSPQGATELTVPPVSSTREMRVMLHVAKGRSAADSSAGLLVATTAPKQAGAAPTIAGDDNPGSAAESANNGTFDVLTRTVASGGAIQVRILSPRNGMRIALTDGQSREVAGTNVGADVETVTL